MRISRSLCKLLSLFTLLVAFTSANTMCYWIAHQPPAPEELKRMRKFSRS